MNKRQRFKQAKQGKTKPYKGEMTFKQAVDLLNNFTHCLNPPQYVDKKNCPGCQHYQACAYSGKEIYRRVKA